MMHFILCSDDVESVLNDGQSFLKFCPDWKNSILWDEWIQFGIKCFSQGLPFVHRICHIIKLFPEPIESPPKKDHSKTITTKIPIPMELSGYPELPTTTMSDGYKTKVVQSMLREYCTAHMRTSYFNKFLGIPNTYPSGFLTGKKMQIIPWGALVKDPSSWILDESIPDGFEWKDPSKIQIGEIFRLLDHWRDRKDQGLNPIIWVPTCPLFQDMDQSSKRVWNLWQARALDPQDSDEEVFVLPLSMESDDERQDESEENDTSKEPSSDGKSMDSGNEPPLLSMSHVSGKHHTSWLSSWICFPYYICTI